MDKPGRWRTKGTRGYAPVAMVAGAVGLAVALGWAGAAQAERTWETEGGVYLAYRFGSATQHHLGFGFEVRRMYAERTFVCDGHSIPRHTQAAVAARMSFFGFREARVVIAPQLGLGARGDSMPWALGGEVGLGVRLGPQQGLFVQPGVEGSVAEMVGRGGYQFGRSAEQETPWGGTMDLGWRYPAASDQVCVIY